MTVCFNILGSGEWGLSIANLLASNGHKVEVFGRDEEKIDSLQSTRESQSLDVKFSENIVFSPLRKITNDSVETVGTFNIIATNSKGFASVIRDKKIFLKQFKHITWLTKGMDSESTLLFDELIKKTLGTSITSCMISGPSFARDLIQKKDIEVSIASLDLEFLKDMKQHFSTSYFKLISTQDIIGVQISSVMKNIAAILSGALTAHGCSKRELIRMIEMSKVEINNISKIIYDSRGLNVNSIDLTATLASPACHGDLFLSCLENQSRNRTFGMQLQNTEGIPELISKIGTVEGYISTSTLHNYLHRSHIGPVLESTYGLLFGGIGIDKTPILNYL